MGWNQCPNDALNKTFFHSHTPLHTHPLTHTNAYARPHKIVLNEWGSDIRMGIYILYIWNKNTFNKIGNKTLEPKRKERQRQRVDWIVYVCNYWCVSWVNFGRMRMWWWWKGGGRSLTVLRHYNNRLFINYPQLWTWTSAYKHNPYPPTTSTPWRPDAFYSTLRVPASSIPYN